MESNHDPHRQIIYIRSSVYCAGYVRDGVMSDLQECGQCGGDGIERCDNPDHGFLNAISFRGANESACPCCGHDEFYRMRTYIKGKYVWNDCPECNGTGKLKARSQS